jgi:hypothetical protein
MLRARWVTLRARWVILRARLVTLRARRVTPRARWVTLRARWVTLRARWVTLRARWVTLRARWVMLRARWVTLRARWVMLRARWVMLRLAGCVRPHNVDTTTSSLNLKEAGRDLTLPYARHENHRETRGDTYPRPAPKSPRPGSRFSSRTPAWVAAARTVTVLQVGRGGRGWGGVRVLERSRWGVSVELKGVSSPRVNPTEIPIEF